MQGEGCRAEQVNSSPERKQLPKAREEEAERERCGTERKEEAEEQQEAAASERD